jgi:hypothetical protein
MDPGKYADKGAVDPSLIDRMEHTLFIFSHAEETEAIGECDFSNDIEGITLKPML